MRQTVAGGRNTPPAAESYHRSRKSGAPFLLGHDAGIIRSRGHWIDYKGIPVMPTFHPAYLLRQTGEGLKEAKWQVYYDLKAAKDRAAEAVPGWVWKSDTPPDLLEELKEVREKRMGISSAFEKEFVKVMDHAYFKAGPSGAGDKRFIPVCFLLSGSASYGSGRKRRPVCSSVRHIKNQYPYLSRRIPAGGGKAYAGESGYLFRDGGTIGEASG